MKNQQKVKGSLIGVNKNRFILILRFTQLAQKQGFSQEWINNIVNKAMYSDDDHALKTLSKNMEDK